MTVAAIRRKAPVAVLLLWVSTGALAETRALGTLIDPWSQRLGANIVLDPRLSLSHPVQVGAVPGSLEALAALLARNGLSLQPLDNGDWLITAAESLSLKLGPLSVEDTALLDPDRPDLGEQVASTTRIQGESLVAAADRELDHLYLRAANVFGARESFYIRGVPRSGDLSTIGNAGVFMDGVPVPGPVLANVPLATWGASDVRFRRGADDLDDHGPFSAYAGSVELDFGIPAFDNSVRIQGRVSDLGDHAASLLVDRVIQAEELALRVGVDSQSLAGTLDDRSDGVSSFDVARSEALRVSGRWEPVSSVGLGVTGSALWLQGDSGPQTLLQPETAEDPFSRDGGFAPIDGHEVRFGAVSGRALLETLGGHQWSLHLGAGDARVDTRPSRSLANQVLPRFEVIDQSRSRTTTLALGWRRLLHETLRASAGLSLGESEDTEQVERDRATWTVRRRLLRQTAALGLEWDAPAGFSVMTRLRFDHDRLTSGCRVRGSTGAGFAEDRALTCTRLVGFYAALDDEYALAPIRETFSSLSPEWTLTWDANPRDRWFARQYRAHNAGGAVSSVTLSGDPFWVVYEPESSSTAEIGWVRGVDGLTSRLTAFYSTLDNQWSPDLTGSSFPLTTVGNTGKSRHLGVEWDGEWDLGEDHRLQWSLGWLDTRFIRYLPFESDADLVPVGGNEFPGAPRYSGSVSYRHRFGEGWSFAAVVSHHAAAFANANNRDIAKVPSATLVDVALTRRWSRVSLRGEVRNLFDQDHLETTPRLLPNSDLIEFAPGRPRSVTLVLDLHF